MADVFVAGATGWRYRQMPEDFEQYMKIKRQADIDLAATDHNWIIGSCRGRRRRSMTPQG